MKDEEIAKSEYHSTSLFSRNLLSNASTSGEKGIGSLFRKFKSTSLHTLNGKEKETDEGIKTESEKN